MLLNVFNLLLTFGLGPIYEIDVINNPSYDFTYNELVLNYTLVARNNIFYTQDTFYASSNINLDDYINSPDIGKLTLFTQTGAYYVDNDYFEMNIYNVVNIYDTNYDLVDGVMIDTNINGILAEGFNLEFSNIDYLIDFTYTLYDFNNIYDKGYLAGKADGLEQGYDEGYEEGKADGLEQGRTEGQGVNNVITWFGSVWDGLAKILSLEIAPNLTIGTIITIPIVIAVLFFGLKALIQ